MANLEEVFDAAVVLLEALFLEGPDCDFELVEDLLLILEDVDDELGGDDEADEQWVRFNPDDKKWTATVWKETFRFEKCDMGRLIQALQLPEVMYTAGRKKRWTAMEGMCVVLRRLSYPCRLKDLEETFGRRRTDLSEIFNSTVLFLYNQWRDLLTTLAHPWLSPERLALYADAVADQCTLSNVWGFIDGTVRPICHPIIGQRLFSNGHKRVHALKFQSVVSPDGMIVNIHGPFEGRRHDAFLLTDSGLLLQLEANMDRPNPAPGSPAVYSLNGDPAYPIRAHLLCPHRGGNLPAAEQQFNSEMSAVRVAVEWEFGRMLQQFTFIDFKKKT